MLCSSNLNIYWGVLIALAVVIVLLIVRTAVYYSCLSKLKKYLFAKDGANALKMIKTLKAQTLMPYQRAAYSVMAAVLMYDGGDKDGCANTLGAVKNKKAAFAKYYWLTIIDLIDGNLDSAAKHFDEFENSPNVNRVGQSYAEYESRLKTIMKYKQDGSDENEVRKIVDSVREINPLYGDTLNKLIVKKDKKSNGGK
jgi:hypothetical protein